MRISEELQRFIEENINLIEQNTKKSWEKIYDRLAGELEGELTQLMLKLGTDPAEVLEYIPENYLYSSEIDRYIIPNNVTRIGMGAFAGCSSLTSMEIPDSVTSIDTSAFFNCDSLTSVVIGGGVTNIRSLAFYGCTRLTSIIIPNNVTNIGYRAFQYCNSLTNVTIPNSVTSISENMFSNCTNLKEINYIGTKEEAVELGIGDSSKKEWRNNSAISKIICTDGEITIQKQ